MVRVSGVPYEVELPPVYNNDPRLKAFLLDLVDPEMYGHAVSLEVRQRASKLIKDLIWRTE
jgi:hypothetical protein